MSHLTDHELVDALDANLPSGAAAHLRDCAECRDQLAALAQVLASSRQAEVPEPSPLFWDHLSARVREATAEHPQPIRHGWLAWPVLAPLGGLALIVFVLVAGLTREVPPSPGGLLAADNVMLQDIEAVEAAWAFTASLIGMPDAVTAFETDLVVSIGSAEHAAAQLTPDEQAELVRLLQQELKVGG
jgi:predicted anti-sigma-YlaC factor YlaD